MEIWLILFALVGLAIYFIPASVALAREHENALAITTLNLFLGWTLLGWVIALVWACTGPGAAAKQVSQAWKQADRDDGGAAIGAGRAHFAQSRSASKRSNASTAVPSLSRPRPNPGSPPTLQGTYRSTRPKPSCHPDSRGGIGADVADLTAGVRKSVRNAMHAGRELGSEMADIHSSHNNANPIGAITTIRAVPTARNNSRSVMAASVLSMIPDGQSQ
jgi:hypothetical protein